jgi:hypothetical protein
MNPVTCRTFRAQLERALRGRPEQSEAAGLVWHEHLLGCAECRALLEAEEALEELLASLPEPHLPEHLAARVLARLEVPRAGSAGEGLADRVGGEPAVPAKGELDELLELDREPVIPTDLSSRVLTGLAEVRHAEREEQREEHRLDTLLALVPEPVAPDGLAGRLLASLESARRPAPALRLLRGGTVRMVAAAALVAVLGLVSWRAFGARAVEPGGSGEELVMEAELIASLDVLERWDLLVTSDLDMLLTGLDPVIETLLEAETIDAELPIPAGEEGETREGEPKRG